MTVAIFDLDHTLIDTDSDHAWGEFLVEKKLVDSDVFQKANEYFYQQYKQGTLNLDEYLDFALKPLTEHEPENLYQLREEFVAERMKPLIKPKVAALLQKHRELGHALLVITATNRFVVEPIIAAIGIEDFLAIDLEMKDGRYTGRPSGIPSFREGKITRFQQWLDNNPGHDFESAWFYSDSMNDLPLLEKVGNPVVVDGDERLIKTAQERNWPVTSLKQ
ncbi:HAD family hydrolase [Parendozoicomonas haliclonae]|uniref:Haloacid dehalogenase-like hydrolase n=1 Tax=Parendozoicomonas haliclonae TaxID=1960125 RepID=A0A1X7AFL7_9GAMM|nr:HAD family hydrolase [Parendozoicomonas haliclonae]SMA37985.1 haloacid dehalogenase-like hydrolase [Parendozoicomonas haliclonae]